jgi:hypothetical protein
MLCGRHYRLGQRTGCIDLLRAGRSGVRTPVESRYFLLSIPVKTGHGAPPSLHRASSTKKYRALSWGQSCRAVALNTHRYLGRGLSLSRAIALLSGVARNFFGGGITTGKFSGGRGSTNSVEDRGQRERGSKGVSPLLRGSTQFANE